MKKLICQFLSIAIFFISACAPSATNTSIAATQNATATPSPAPTNTNTYVPTETPTAPTAATPALAPGASVTPLPTIPAFTPTFDTSTITTVTPAPEAECPKIDLTIRVEDYLPEKLDYPSPDTTARILDFLNTGGDDQALIARLEKVYPYGGDYRGGYGFYDVTGDQLPELLFVELKYEGKPVIFSCQNGRYKLLATLSGKHDSLDYTFQTDDLNMNGIPEIIVTATDGVSFPQCIIYIFEWNGQTFPILGQVGILALRQTKITDIDGNGTKEVLFIGDNPGCLSCKNFVPQRQRTIMSSWDGKEFVEISNEFESPEYRFQAIQDADAAVAAGKFDKAIQLYEKAILNKKLEWWSAERLEYERALSDSWIPDLTLPPEPSEDKTEYPRLAAYAYYRILLIKLLQGNETEASTSYNALQQKFGNDPYGHPYVEMATAFWNIYQSTHKMYNGCAAAIHYAAEHPEILTPLGSDYHGWQSHIYVPADICPFR